MLCNLLDKYQLLEAPAAFICMSTYFRDVYIYQTTRRHISAHITVQITSRSNLILHIWLNSCLHGVCITILWKRLVVHLFSLQLSSMIICVQIF
jgi:hypothetical protein